MASYGIKISKPTKVVETAPTKDLVIDSGAENLKNPANMTSDIITTVLSGLGTGSFYTDVAFTHNLGYIPAFKVYFDCSDNNWRNAVEDSEYDANGNYVGGLPPIYCRFWSTSTQVCGYIQNEDSVPRTVRYRIFVFRNTNG